MSTTNQTIDSYNNFAEEYTNQITSQNNFWNKYLEAPAMENLLKDKVSGKAVLDLGCGSGVSTIKLKNWNANVVGVDISEKMVDIAKREYPEINFNVASVEDLPFPENRFDIVASSLVFHYIQDLTKVFKEVNRVLKTSGSLIFSMHHPFHGSRERVVINDEKRYVMAPYFHNNKYQWSMFGGEMVLEVYHHTFSNIANSLIESGFSIEKVVETVPVEEGKLINAKDYELTSNYPSFIVFSAKKTS